MPFRIFNLSEAAEYLHLAETRLEELARRGEIPCEKQGGRLVFRHNAVDEWASQRLLGSSADKLEDFHRRSTAKYHDLAAEALSLASGVDLNSEATDMLRLQQAYGANARIIQAAREIFETLLQSSR